MNKKRVTWSPEEEYLLLEYVHRFKHKWGLIVDYFDDFSEMQLKNKYYKMLKRGKRYTELSPLKFNIFE